MHLSPAFFAGALLLAFEASATATTKSYVTCITKQGPKPVATVKTTSRILTVPFYGFKFTTKTPTYVVTPPPVTATVTVTATSVMTETHTQETDTFSETVTTTDTVLTTSTDITRVTDTATLTITLAAATTTVVPPFQFQPIQSTFPNRKRRSASIPEVASNESALEERGQAQRIIFNKGRKPTCEPPVYPQGVACVGIAKVISTSTITRTAKRTTTVTTSAPTSSVTTTITEVSTTTLTPVRAATTVTVDYYTAITQTIVEPSTITTVTTQTIEVAAPASTFYAACGADNFISSTNGQVSSQILTNGLSQQSVVAGSIYGCCAACISTFACVGSVFQVVNGQSYCYFFTRNSGACAPASLGGQIILQDGTPDGSVLLSNGICGKYYV